MAAFIKLTLKIIFSLYIILFALIVPPSVNAVCVPSQCPNGDGDCNSNEYCGTGGTCCLERTNWPTPTSGGGGGGGGSTSSCPSGTTYVCGSTGQGYCVDAGYQCPFPYKFGPSNGRCEEPANNGEDYFCQTSCSCVSSATPTLVPACGYCTNDAMCQSGNCNFSAGNICNPITSCFATPTPTRTPTSTPTPTRANTPTPNASCSVSSAVLSLGNFTLAVGSSRAVTLTVNDSPGGCTQSASFVRSNTNAGLSTSSDSAEPFTTTITCNTAGNTVITGRAITGGVVVASDSLTVTCGNASTPTPTRVPTATPRPTATPTTPPNCTTGSWTNGSCGGGTCANDQRYQTRTVSPSGCTFSTRCVADSACSASPTPTRANTPTASASCSIGSAVFSASSVSMAVGATRTLSFTSSDNPGGCTTDAVFSRSNTNSSFTTANPDSSEPFTITVRCDVPGSTVITGQARVGGTARASDSVTVNCAALATPTNTPSPRPTNTPTPTPVPVCSTPRPRDPPTVTCGTPGTIKWEWSPVANANQYELVILNDSGAVVQNYGWLSSGSYNCGSGTCSRTENRSGGPYRSRIRARNTNTLLCQTSAASTSSSVTVYGCPSINLPDMEINGAPSTVSTGPITTSNIPNTSPMNFSVTDTSIATVNPVSDLPAYQTDITSLQLGNTTYTATVNDYYGNPFSATADIAVVNPRPWCQIKSGDIVAMRSISCNIPGSCGVSASCSPYLIVSESGERPGLPIAGGSISAGSGQISSNSQAVSGDAYSGEAYDYDYLAAKVSGANFSGASGEADLLTGTPDGKGYTWKRSSGNMTISGNIDIGSRKVVLFVPGDLTVRGKINLTDGQGFFMAVVRGDIIVESGVHDSGSLGSNPDSVPEMEGIYFTEGAFNSQSAGDDSDIQLHVKGVVAAGEFILEKDLQDNSGVPSEYFEFAPDLVLRLPEELSRKQIIWREVAP